MNAPRHESITDFMHRYCESFRPGNAAQIISFFHCPLTLLQGGIPRVFASQANLQVLFEGLLSALVQRDFKESKLDRLSCVEVADETFFVSAAFTRYTVAGDRLERVGATYTVTRADNAFRIAAIVAHDADAVITFATQN